MTKSHPSWLVSFNFHQDTNTVANSHPMNMMSNWSNSSLGYVETQLVPTSNLGLSHELQVSTQFANSLNTQLLTQSVSSSSTVASTYSSGIFTVGATGQVSVDYLYDGGGFEGELAIFSLQGMNQYQPGSVEFIQEASRRALSNSTWGHIVLQDDRDAARFTPPVGSGHESAWDWNHGDYRGVQTFAMRSGDQFGIMLVPLGKVQQVFDDPLTRGATRPLFSLVSSNPSKSFQMGQIADVTGHGNTFVMEDLRLDQGSDLDYNDVIFQIRGAIGDAVLLDDVINPKLDWRETEWGQSLGTYTHLAFMQTQMEDASQALQLSLQSINDQVADDIPESVLNQVEVNIDQLLANFQVDFEIDPNASPEDAIEQFSNAFAPDYQESTIQDWLNDSAFNPLPDLDLPLLANSETFPNQHSTSNSDIFSTTGIQQPLIGLIDAGFKMDYPGIDYSSLILGRDYIDNDNDPLLQLNEKGDDHGTHLLGLISAKRDGIGLEGINDQAPMWLGRAVGSGRWAESLTEFVETARARGNGNAIANLSFDLVESDLEDPDGKTRYQFTEAEWNALELAHRNGVLVVVSAGNEGAATMSALGQATRYFDNILTVGAADGNQRASYSSYGTGLSLLADGGMPEDLSQDEDDALGIAGTSTATARVAGIASQIWAANPELSYRQIIDLLQSTATDLGTPGWDDETGFGLIDPAGAMAAATSWTAPPSQMVLEAKPESWWSKTVTWATTFERPNRRCARKTWLQIRRKFRSILSKTLSFVGKVVKVINKTASLLPKIANGLTKFASSFLSGKAFAIFSKVAGFLTKVATALTPIGKWLGTALKIVNGTVKVVTSIVNAFKRFFKKRRQAA